MKECLISSRLHIHTNVDFNMHSKISTNMNIKTTLRFMGLSKYSYVYLY